MSRWRSSQPPHPITPLIVAARALPLDSPPRVLAAIAGIVGCGVEQPATVLRALLIAGASEATIRAAIAGTRAAQ